MIEITSVTEKICQNGHKVFSEFRVFNRETTLNIASCITNVISKKQVPSNTFYDKDSLATSDLNLKYISISLE